MNADFLAALTGFRLYSSQNYNYEKDLCSCGVSVQSLAEYVVGIIVNRFVLKTLALLAK